MIFLKATGVEWARIQNMEKSDESIQNPQIDKIISILNAGVLLSRKMKTII